MIAIIDYGMGNLRSVQKAIEKVGHEAIITGDFQQLEKAEKIILPGVGAFRDAMSELKRLDLVKPIEDAITADKPFLGICLGLQLLFDVSYEYGIYEGLGIIPGKVVRFEPPESEKVPHMGWNQISIKRPAPLLDGLQEDSYVYFVHSYYVAPEDDSVIATTTNYAGEFTSMIWRKNLFATQFHPEKSQNLGLRILQNFAEFATTLSPSS
ncbi:Imidazole glycerol phosphate synthase subunit HisH [Planctomycetales bacterium 10988]|nr:Imidazole glycerol phosphate synthase subunit HisH [Planctomycetales bacterium 10988]